MTETHSHSGWAASESLFQQIWATSLDAMVLSDASGAVVLANPAYYELCANTPEQVLGHDFVLMFPDAEREVARAAYHAIFAAGRPIEHMEGLVRRSDGSMRTVETRASFIERDGQRYLLSAIRDITTVKSARGIAAELKRSLEARVTERTAQLAETIQELLEEVSTRQAVQTELQAVLRLQRAILDSVSYAIIATRLDGTIVSFNPAAEHMLGYKAEAVVDVMSLVNFHDPDELHSRLKAMAPVLGINLDPALGILHYALTEAQPYEAEWMYRRSDGSTLPVSVALTTLCDDNGIPEGFLAVVSDISQRRAAEEVLRQANADLARAARLKDEFLANMSHELRTPLNAILGRAEMLLEQVFGPLNERQLRSIHSIEESGRDLLALINDILDIAKIESGRMDLQLDHCDVAAVCNASMRMIAESAAKKRISLNLRLDPAVTAMLADQRRLKQILVNLLSNAVKFTPLGGKIGFEVQGHQVAGEVHFTVWDTGIGINLEDQQRLFQPFVQIDSSLSRQYAGTGLGLSLVDRLTRMHGGHVELVSAPGQGSRFTVVVPWRQATLASLAREGAELAHSEQSVPLRNALVLVVDDNAENIELLREYLEAHDYVVAVAHSGAEALGLMPLISPDLVVMDIQMPGMDGIGVIRQIRSDPTTEHLPIIALTALAMVGDRERCLEAGASAYVSRPYTLKDLIALIAGLIERARNRPGGPIPSQS